MYGVSSNPSPPIKIKITALAAIAALGMTATATPLSPLLKDSKRPSHHHHHPNQHSQHNNDWTAQSNATYCATAHATSVGHGCAYGEALPYPSINSTWTPLPINYNNSSYTTQLNAIEKAILAEHTYREATAEAMAKAEKYRDGRSKKGKKGKKAFERAMAAEKDAIVADARARHERKVAGEKFREIEMGGWDRCVKEMGKAVVTAGASATVTVTVTAAPAATRSGT